MTKPTSEQDKRNPAPAVANAPAAPPKDTVMRPMRIGINCDANSLFNTDPKDPNKYECEGQKAPLNSAQLCDWYLKLIQEHPLLTFVEDPFAENDVEGYRVF